MPTMITRRAFGASAAVALATPFIRRAEAAAPIELRVSLDTAPSHPRNVAFRDFLAKVEAASNGQIKTKLFESGSLFPDLQVVKALVQGQVEMACPGTWTITGFVPDADFSQLPAFYGRPIDVVHKVTDGSGRQIRQQRDQQEAACGRAGRLVRSRLQQLVLHDEAARFAGRPEGHEAAQPRRRAELLAYPLFRRHSERDRVAGRAAGHVAGHVRRADQQQRKHQQLQAVSIPACSIRCRTSRAWGSTCRWSNQAVLDQARPRSCSTRSCSSGRRTCRPGATTPPRRSSTAARNWQTHGVTFVDVPQAELDAVHAKMVKEQNKAVADAHISPELVKLVMADVGA